MNQKILVVEDNKDIREGICALLSGENFSTVQAENGEDALAKMDDSVSLVLLDVMMPGMSGFDVCQEIRKTSYVPILFLTAKATEMDKLKGMTAGGDDYITKPFSYVELLVRIRALLRRSTEYNVAAQDTQAEYIERDGIRINTSFNEVIVRGQIAELTETEYQLLLLFMKNPKKVFSVQQLYEEVWKEHYLSSSGNTIMVHIRRLRIKIEKDAQHPALIHTVWGKGYRFD